MSCHVRVLITHADGFVVLRGGDVLPTQVPFEQSPQQGARRKVITELAPKPQTKHLVCLYLQEMFLPSPVLSDPLVGLNLFDHCGDA